MNHIERLGGLILFTVGCAAPPSSSAPFSGPNSMLSPAVASRSVIANGVRPEEEPEEEHGEEHGAGTQALNLFLGGSSEFGDRDGETLGVDYEYRLAPKWGVGGFAEGVSGLDRSFSVGAQLYWHPVGELVLVGGPGLERREGQWEPIARFGTFYEFPIGDGWVISPALFYDITTEEGLFIYGFNFGKVW